jgi:hypothetical protein
MLFMLESSPISCLVKQRLGTLSTCEAEYIVAVTTICQGVFLSQLLCKLEEQELAEPTLMMENKLAITMSP